MDHYIDSITNIEQLNTYLRNTDYRLSSEEWVKLTNIASSITGLNKEDVENKLAWLKSKKE